jgi:predicted dienelactone hydrolase
MRRILAGIALRCLAALAFATPAAAQMETVQTGTVQTGFARIEAAGLPVTLVYPTAERATPRGFGPFTITVAPGAEPLPGVRRLVVMSHGTASNALAEHDLAARLAAAGFVVAQPQHSGDNAEDSSAAGPESFRRRPGEVSAVIDALAAHPAWGPRLRLDKVGVHGSSAGAVTALTLAGAEWRLLDLVRHCQAAGGRDLGFCYNDLRTEEARAARRARFEAARGVPELLLGQEMRAGHGGRDARIAVATVAIPVAAIFAADSLARIAIPIGVVAAERDGFTPLPFHADHLLRSCGRCAALAVMRGAGHMDFMSPWPPSVAQAVAARMAVGAMPEPGFDPAERVAAQGAIVAHFQRYLVP